MQGRTKFIIIMFLIVVAILATHIRPRETKTVRCCVTETNYVFDDCYEVTVEYKRNLYSYYDSYPRENGSVIMCTFDENEIINAYEEKGEN